MKNQEIWQEARKLKLGRQFLENLDTLLTSLENKNKKCVIQISDTPFYCYDKTEANAEEDFEFKQCDKQCEKCKQ